MNMARSSLSTSGPQHFGSGWWPAWVVSYALLFGTQGRARTGIHPVTATDLEDRADTWVKHLFNWQRNHRAVIHDADDAHLAGN